MNVTEFKHVTQIRVRSFEVDSQGIVHNIVYLKYFEIGRVEYRRELGYTLLPTGIFNDGLKVVVVHNEIDYNDFSFLDDLLDIYTKISWIKKSSFCFEHIIQNNKTKKQICRGNGILVNINSSNLPEIISNKFINEIKSFENKLELIK